MNQRHFLLKGTFILTLTGLLTRIAGFFYKIFLSRTIGAAQIGLFQLTLPVYAFCMALSCGGIQTAVSRFTAEYYAEEDSRSAIRILYCALFLSVGLSFICGTLMFLGAPWIARSFLLEPSCTMLLQMIAVSVPLSALHGCIVGFFIGRKNVAIPAAAQFVEQLLRIIFVLLIFCLFQKKRQMMNASVMALGQLAGELSAAFFCLYYLFFGKNSPFNDTDDSCARSTKWQKLRTHPTRADLNRTVSVSLPLGLNRMLICVLQGIEAALLPQMLQRFGYDSTHSLAIYGTLSGMAMPLIMFPTAITSALGTLLLPAVSEARALHQDKKISGTVDASFQGSLLLGLFFLCAFLLFGGRIGELLFHSRLAGEFTRKLALLCPFLYLNTTLTSILHGLGATSLVTLWNVAGFGIRLTSVIIFIPGSGIDGYFAGTLLSQIFITACSLFLLHRDAGFNIDLSAALIRPAFICIACGVTSLAVQTVLPYLGKASWGSLFCASFLYTAVFSLLAWFFLPEKIRRQTYLRLPGRS